MKIIFWTYIALLLIALLSMQSVDAKKKKKEPKAAKDDVHSDLKVENKESEKKESKIRFYSAKYLSMLNSF